MTLILVAIGGIVAGGLLAYLFFRRRKPASLEDGLSNFRRGLDALDPANDPLKRNPPKGPRPGAKPGPGGNGQNGPSGSRGPNRPKKKN
jgi:hypothetical protein